MKRVSPYLKMRVLGAIEFAPGKSIRERILFVSTQVFVDENDRRLQFTWRTIQTWYSRYKKDGITAMTPTLRCDRGQPRKVEPELLLDAIEQVLPSFHGKPSNIAAVYRVCIERGLLRREQVAPNTFRRMVNHYELLKIDKQTEDKRRLAFAKPHANDMWQADTMYGPYVQNGSKRTQTRLIAFIDDASRVCCHGEFFLAENTDTLIKALRSALYKRGVPDCMYVDNGSIYTSMEITQICARLGCLLCHAPVRDGAAKGKVERFFRTVRGSFLSKALDLTSVDTSTVPSPPGSRTSTTPASTPVSKCAPSIDSDSISHASVSSPPATPTTSSSSSKKAAPCSPTTPSPSKPSASSAPATSAIAKFKCASIAKTLAAPSSITKVTAWERPAPSTSSETIASRPSAKVSHDPRSFWP